MILDTDARYDRAAIAVSSATYGTALKVLTPSVPVTYPMIGVKPILTFPAAHDVVGPNMFAQYTDMALVSAEGLPGNPEIEELIRASRSMMLRYFGIRRWIVVGTSIEKFEHVDKASDPVRTSCVFLRLSSSMLMI